MIDAETAFEVLSSSRVHQRIRGKTFSGPAMTLFPSQRLYTKGAIKTS
jgi:hypothetical protein